MPLRTSYQLRRIKLFRRRSTRLLLSIVGCALFMVLLRLFYINNTVLVPTKGGTYIEGSIGTLQPLNPWFTITNDVNRDIVSLVFSGLLRYDPATKTIVDDLATMKVSPDGRIYTLTLKDNIYWHDHTLEAPHPVTVDDVLFTFGAIQDPLFSNTLLHQNFTGVDIESLDTRTVRFKLREPYHFFPSNLTLGLLPKRSFEGIAPAQLMQALDFGYNPIGAGPYKFKGLVQTELSTEVTLVRFERTIPPAFHLESIVFRIFPDYSTLLSDLRNMQGVRLVPSNDKGIPLIPNRFESLAYTLPQYVALFFNLDNPLLQDRMLRLGLQLGTNKQELLQNENQQKIVDTPLLEIASNDWRFNYDPTAAQGALFQSNWLLPAKVRLQRILEIMDSNSKGVLQAHSIVHIDGTGSIVLTGSVLDVGSLSGSRLNEIALQPHQTISGAWIAEIPAVGIHALQNDINRLQLINDTEQLVDTFYIRKYSNKDEYRLALNEQLLVDSFVIAGSDAAKKSLLIQEMSVDQGFLRKRTASDPVDIRINSKGQKLALTLLTTGTPPEYVQIAKKIKENWLSLGVHINIEVAESREDFEHRMITRNYDILLFGQSLLDNLDSYPYWHSSGVQRSDLDEQKLALDAYNLSQYKSLKADVLLELIRKTTDQKERSESLNKLQNILREDIPAIVLYSPVYTFAYHQDVHGIELGHPALHSDRFLSLQNWYIRQERKFIAGKNWLSFFSWLIEAI